MKQTTKKAVIPAAFLAALTSLSTITLLESLEGNILRVYPDKLAGGIPTYCAGKTDWKIPLNTTFTTDECREVNKATLLEYGTAVIRCTNWSYLNPDRVVALTMFAINVGVAGACSSQAIKYINIGKVTEGCKLIAYKPSGAPNWSYAGGVFVQGLHNRRIKEMNKCLVT